MDKKTASKQTPAKKISTRSKTAEKASKPSVDDPLKKEKVVISPETIATRAYFISERRQQLGWEGNDITDWVDAEKQLLAESEDKWSLS